MKKTKTCSVQFKIIQNLPNPLKNQFHPNGIENPKKKQSSKSNQEFITNIAASGFENLSALCEA